MKPDHQNPPDRLLWPELIRGTLISRYKRFLADVALDSGKKVTAHCPNSGSMAACSEPGRPVYLSYHDDPQRKLKYTWELIDMPDSLVGTNTLVPNRLVYRAAVNGRINEFSRYDKVTREVSVGNHSRLDLMLENSAEKCFVEIKNCTLVEHRVAMFPDAVTARGLKHLKEMQTLMQKGVRCVMFYLIQRMDARVFRPAAHIDPAYAAELAKAHDGGLEIVVYDVFIDLAQIRLNRKIPFEL